MTKKHGAAASTLPELHVWQRLRRCDLWGEIKPDIRSGENFNPAAGLSTLNLKLMLTIINPFFKRNHEKYPTPHGPLFEAVDRRVREYVKSAEFIVDSSKSVYSMYSLARSPNIDLFVFQIVRDGVSVTAFFKKRGDSFIRGMAVWLLSNVFIAISLKRMRPKLLKLGYENLCRNPDVEFNRIQSILGTRSAGKRCCR